MNVKANCLGDVGFNRTSGNSPNRFKNLDNIQEGIKIHPNSPHISPKIKLPSSLNNNNLQQGIPC